MTKKQKKVREICNFLSKNLHIMNKCLKFATEISKSKAAKEC